jgi:SHS2 domain-containing protein
MYEVFDHTADIGLRIQAATLEELFVDSARGLFALIVNNPDDVRPKESVEVSLAGNKDELDYLFFDWLNELLFLFDSRQLLLSEFAVRLSDAGVQATVHGERFDPARHRLEHELKAITYHGLKVEQIGEQWTAEVVLDI